MSEFTVVERTVYPDETTYLVVCSESSVIAEVTKQRYDGKFDFNVQFGFVGYDGSIDLYGAGQFNKFKALVEEVDQLITDLGEPQI